MKKSLFNDLFEAEQNGYVTVKSNKKTGELNVKLTKKGYEYLRKLNTVC